jgi:ATP-dependent helicase/nuclease subunit B
VVLDEDDLAPRNLPAGEEMTRLAAVFEQVVARLTPPQQATLRERVIWVEELIGDDAAPAPEDVPLASAGDETSLRVVARAREAPGTAERDCAALRTFKDIVRGLVLADALFSEGRDGILPYDRFVTDVTQAIGDTTYTTPAESEAILVATVLEARGLTFHSVAIVGLAEGDFPRAEREDALLREADRAWLAEQGFAVEARLQGDEATLFYQAVTRARQRLLLSRPYLADDGQPWEPSPYWSAVLRLFEDAPLAHVRPTDPVNDVASEQELASAVPGEDLRLPLAVLRARSRPDPSPWSGDLSTLKEQLAERFGPDRLWSSSRLETYARCPFYFWAAYVMELEPRKPPEAGFDALILGSIHHQVLERLYARVPDGDADQLRAELPVVACQVFDAAPDVHGFRPTALWERQREELTDVLRRTVDALIEVAGEYAPLVLEQPFGSRGWPLLVLQGELPLRLRGYIDRVDRAPDGRLRIIDYKTGSKLVSARDLADGQRMQLPLYALAAREALGVEVASGFYWHINPARPSTLRLEEFTGGVTGAIETAVDHAQSIGAAVLRGQFTPMPSDDGCPGFCPTERFCARFRRRLW